MTREEDETATLDMSRAMVTAKEVLKAYGLDPNNIGVMFPSEHIRPGWAQGTWTQHDQYELPPCTDPNCCGKEGMMPVQYDVDQMQTLLRASVRGAAREHGYGLGDIANHKAELEMPNWMDVDGYFYWNFPARKWDLFAGVRNVDFVFYVGRRSEAASLWHWFGLDKRMDRAPLDEVMMVSTFRHIDNIVRLKSWDLRCAVVIIGESDALTMDTDKDVLTDYIAARFDVTHVFREAECTDKRKRDMFTGIHVSSDPSIGNHGVMVFDPAKVRVVGPMEGKLFIEYNSRQLGRSALEQYLREREEYGRTVQAMRVQYVTTTPKPMDAMKEEMTTDEFRKEVLRWATGSF